MESQQVLQEATQRISVYKLYGVLNLSVSTFAISAIATFVIIWLVICIYYRPTQWGSSSWRTARRKSFSWSVLVPRWFIQSFQALRFLWNAPEIIEVAYAKANGRPFVIQTPTNRHYMVSSPEQIRELNEAPYHQLSLHAAAKEFLRPEYTMQGYQIQDTNGVSKTSFARALRSLLAANVPFLYPKLQCTVDNGLKLHISRCKEVGGWSHVRAFEMVKSVVVKANCVVFFGEELCHNDEFTDALLQYPQDVIKGAEVVRITPKVIAHLMAGAVTNRFKAAKTIFRILLPVVADRLRFHVNGKSFASQKPRDCMQWLIDASPRANPWSVSRMTHEIMGVWLGSVHQPAMTITYAVQDLCLHNEYRTQIRKQLDALEGSLDYKCLEDLPLLDSFMKESARLSSSDAVTARRKAVAPFVFADGTKVNGGDWVSVPLKGMMTDPHLYNNPLFFDGSRFIDGSSTLKSKFTDIDDKFLIWGLSRTSCPGRFYASMLEKIVLSQIISNYDFELLNSQAPRSFTWRTSIVPRSDKVLVMKARKTPALF